MNFRNGFTLVELLVVVSIIVVLLALLMPALDQAVYQAELAVCGARLKGHGTAAIAYTMDFKRRYLHRPGVHEADYWRADWMAFTTDPQNDDRPALRPYMPINKMVACPLVQEVDFDHAEQYANVFPAVLLYTSFTYWYGFRYTGQKGMFRMGDRLGWREGAAGPSTSFSVLASDTDVVSFSGRYSNSAHPDKDEFLVLTTFTNARGTNYHNMFSFWGRWSTDPDRGPMDRSFVFDDLSAQTFNDVLLEDDPRMVPVSEYSHRTTSELSRSWLPRQ